MKVLIVPDKFKGTLTAHQAAEAIAQGWKNVRPSDDLELLPMTDGGDGFGEILGHLLNAKRQHYRTLNAAHEPIDGEWWWSESRQTAIVESARIIGLAMLPPGKFHPFQLDTRGLGQLLRHIAAEHTKTSLLIGIGGSATNDAGFGMALGLGYRFRDGISLGIEHWPQMDRLLNIDLPLKDSDFLHVTIACDVQNPLLGPEGASRIYGPQKGLRPEDFPVADRCFERLTEIVKRDLNRDYAGEPGTGAAGGLGYGVRAFLNGEFKPGFEIFAEAAQLREKIARADLVITGEGAIDPQTEMGKGTGAVAKLTRGAGKRCIALAGHVSPKLTANNFEFALGITPFLTNKEDAFRDPQIWLAKVGEHAARKLDSSR
jgi:glycerate kinase